MIPKVIHYCWFGRGPLPPLAVKCIASWRKFLPDYEIREWNEDNFDVGAIAYTREAYAARKYAFVSDYARFKILYEHGGLYFDTDVEVIRPLDDLIARGPFMGCERDASSGSQVIKVNPGLGIGCEPQCPFYKSLLDLYATLHFVNPDGSLQLKTVVRYTTELLLERGLKNIATIQQIAGIWIYPQSYFCPISVIDGKLRIKAETRTIHHYAQSWRSPIRQRARQIVLRLGGARLKGILKKLLSRN